MTSIGLATGGILSGGGVGLATHGIASSLGEDAPAANACGIPGWAPRNELHQAPEINPRWLPPGMDPALHLNPSPGTSLVEMIAPSIDAARQLIVDLGMRPYLVFSVVIRWTGGEPHRGEPRVIFEAPLLPVPQVENIEQLNRELRSGGTLTRGEVRLTQISPRYTADDIATLFPCELQKSDEHFIEVRIDERDGRTQRQRYVIAGVPERRPEEFDWSVRMKKQDEARLRDGRVRNA